MSFQGRDYTGVHPYRIIEARYATEGFAKNHATESGTWGLRNMGNLTLSPKSYPTFLKSPFVYGYDVNLTIPTYQSNLPALRNAMLMSKSRMGIYVTTAEGKFLSFDTNFARCLGISHTFELSSENRVLNISALGYISKTEWEAVLAGSATLPSNMTSGVSLGLTASAFDLEEVSLPYIDRIAVDSVLVGHLQDPRIVHTQTNRVDQYGTPIGKQAIMAELTFRCMQEDIPTLQGAQDAVNNLSTFSAFTLNGEEFRYTGGAIMIEPSPYFGDDDRYLQIRVAGEMIYNTDESAPDSLDIGVGSASIFECKLRGAV